MKKKEYMQPATQVVELRHQPTLLAGSGVPQDAEHSDYESEEWP